MNSRQEQRGGPGSKQIQVSGDLYLVDGISEERAIEISRQQAQFVIQEFSAEAEDTALKRINSFGQKLVDDLADLGQLKAFADPAFQILLRKTQLHAAATSEGADHELLSKLLAERAEDSSKPMHMVVTRAVEVVEQIDSTALKGLTLLWFAGTVIPSAADPKSGLAAIEVIASKLADGELPTGTSWLQRLDMMDCIRYTPQAFNQSMRKWPDLLSLNAPGYVCEGILDTDADAIRVRLDRVVPNLGSLVVEHTFLDGRFRVNTLSSTQLIKILDPQLQILSQLKAKIPSAALDQLTVQQPLEMLGSRKELQAILTEARVDDVNAEATEKMSKYIESEVPNVKKMRTWWDSFRGIFEITPIGTAVAYSNAKRFDQLHGLGALSEMIGRLMQRASDSRSACGATVEGMAAIHDPLTRSWS